MPTKAANAPIAQNAKTMFGSLHPPQLKGVMDGRHRKQASPFAKAPLRPFEVSHLHYDRQLLHPENSPDDKEGHHCPVQ